jgi:multidrug transporter EmrE-like cation transporter
VQQTTLWLSLAIVATVAYHVVFKLTPATVNPFLSLSVTYALGALLFVGALLVTEATPAGVGFDWRGEFAQLNWTSIALALAVVSLDIGFLMLYRSGFEVSLGAIVTQTAAGVLLLVVGLAFFREALSLMNVVGIGLCVLGLWLVHQR